MSGMLPSSAPATCTLSTLSTFVLGLSDVFLFQGCSQQTAEERERSISTYSTPGYLQVVDVIIPSINLKVVNEGEKVLYKDPNIASLVFH